jgi:hypothetical protein
MSDATAPDFVRRMLSMSTFQSAETYSASTVGEAHLAALMVDPL